MSCSAEITGLIKKTLSPEAVAKCAPTFQIRAEAAEKENAALEQTLSPSSSRQGRRFCQVKTNIKLFIRVILGEDHMPD